MGKKKRKRKQNPAQWAGILLSACLLALSLPVNLSSQAETGKQEEKTADQTETEKQAGKSESLTEPKAEEPAETQPETEGGRTPEETVNPETENPAKTQPETEEEAVTEETVNPETENTTETGAETENGNSSEASTNGDGSGTETMPSENEALSGGGTEETAEAEGEQETEADTEEEMTEEFDEAEVEPLEAGTLKYQVTIPEGAVIPEGEGTLNLSCVMEGTGTVEIQVNSSQGFRLVNTQDSSVSLPYSLRKSGDAVKIENNQTAASFTGSGDQTLTVALDQPHAYIASGTYQDTLTFRVSAE